MIVAKVVARQICLERWNRWIPANDKGSLIAIVVLRSACSVESKLDYDKGISKPVRSVYDCQSMLMRKNNVRTSVVG